MIYISSDHRGYELKNYLIKELTPKGTIVMDLGPFNFNPDDDYPDYAKLVAKKIQENPHNMGILICANGVGMSIAANKFKGVRASISWNSKHAATSRNDDKTNILVLPSDFIIKEEALEITQTWLSTDFSGEERHLRRIMKITSFEESNF
jgi:ribose 5-phosphate isomerase B